MDLIALAQVSVLLAAAALAHYLTAGSLAYAARCKAKIAAGKRLEAGQMEFLEPVCDALRIGDQLRARDLRRAVDQHAQDHLNSL